MKNKILSLALAVLLIFTLTSCGSSDSETDTAEKIGIHHAVITVKGYGEVKLELDGDTAPITVKNFIDLANDGFYDGLTFHRVAKDFVIQGGDPNGNGSGGSGKTIKGEFSANGIENNITHTRGVISMARRGDDNNSATSQFFIVLHDSATSSLDGSYAAFGRVTSGMDIIDKVVRNTPVVDANGTVLSKYQPQIEKIEIID